MMIRLLALLWFVSLGALISLTPTTGRADAPSEIQTVIENQLSAFSENDVTTAFAYASPTIQSIFMSPDNFGRMVRQGYPMVWRQSSVTFLSITRQSYGFDQVIMIKDLAGQSHYLKYAMVKLDTGWRINGVAILQASDFSV